MRNTLEPPGTHFARSRESPYVHSFSWRFTCKWGYVIESRVFPSICVLRHQNRSYFRCENGGAKWRALSDRSEFDIGDPDWEEIEEIEEYDHLAELLGNVLQDDEEDVQPDFARFIGESTGDSDRFQRRVTSKSSSFTRRWSTFLSFKSLIKHRISFFCFILNLFCESLCRKQTGTEPNKWGRKVFPRDHLSGTDMKWVQKKSCICQTCQDISILFVSAERKLNHGPWFEFQNLFCLSLGGRGIARWQWQLCDHSA